MSRAVVALATLSLMVGDQLPGQGRNRAATTPQEARSTQVAHVLRNVGDLTFEIFYRAMSQSEYEIVQVRRVPDGSQAGRWVGLEEKIHHGFDTRGAPVVSLDLLRLEGESLTNEELDQRRWEYESKASFIYMYQSFRVHDVRRAAANYRIYPIVTTERLDRPVLRVVVYPLRWDRSIWLLDVDTETGYPLYCAEYNSRAQLLSEVIVTDFKPGQTVVTEGARWKPTNPVVQYDSIDAARQALGNVSHHMIDVDEGGLPPGYKRSVTQTVRDSLTGAVNYVSIFTDGIDNIFLVQTPGAPNPLDDLRLGIDGAHTVAEYRDLNVAQFVFFEDDVRFMVVGRSTLEGLRPAVKAMYLQAIK